MVRRSYSAFVFRGHPVLRTLQHLDQILIDGYQHAGTADFLIQLARNHQHGIADLFRFKATACELPEQRVFGIFLHRDVLDGRFARLPVGARKQNHAVQRLHLPAVRDVLVGKDNPAVRDSTACRPCGRNRWRWKRCRGRNDTARCGSTITRAVRGLSGSHQPVGQLQTRRIGGDAALRECLPAAECPAV